MGPDEPKRFAWPAKMGQASARRRGTIASYASLEAMAINKTIAIRAIVLVGGPI